MIIRQASIREFKALWDFSGSNTYHYFLDGMNEKIIELWTIEIDKELVGELYIFWNSEDKDEANGHNRAYLCAFRIKENYQGRRLASLLMNRVLERIAEKGYNEVTIGVDNDNYHKLFSMYNRWGFDTLIKKTCIDFHYLDKDNNPVTYDESFDLLLNHINTE